VERYRVALIGLGRIASTIDDEVADYSAVMLPYAHMACYREVPAVEVVAAVDPYAEPIRRVFPRPQRIQSPGVRAIQDLIACLETGKEPNCSGEDGRAALEVAIALRESYRRGGTRVDLPLADRTPRILSAETLHGDVPVALRQAHKSA